MPELNNEYTLNSYNLLKDAYGDDLPVSQEDFLNKIKNDKDGKYRDNVYNLLKDKYGKEMQQKVTPNEFRNKFFISDFQEESEQVNFGLQKVQEQVLKGEKGEEQELPPEEYFKQENAGTGLYRKSKEKKLTSKYWEEQLDILTQRQERVKSDMSVEEKVFKISGLERQAIQEDDTPNLVEEGYDIDVINYIKKEKQFEDQKQQIYSSLEGNTDATLNLSLFNYAKNKDKLPERDINLKINLDQSDFYKLRDYDDRVEYLQKQADLYVEQNKGKGTDETKLRKDYYLKAAPFVLFDDDGTPSMFAIQNMAEIKSKQMDSQIELLQKELNNLSEEKTKDLRTPGYKTPKEQPKDIFSKEALLYSYNSHKNDDQMRILGKEINDLSMAKESLKKALNKPIGEGRFYEDVGRGIADTDWQDQLSIGLKSIAESVDLAMLNKKYKSGAQLTSSEQTVLDALGIMNYAAQKANVSGWYEIGQGLAQMPAYMVGFSMASPLYSSVKGSAQKAVGKVIQKQIKKQAIGKLGQWMAHTGLPGAIGTIPATIANPSTSIIENTAINMTEAVDIALTDEVDELHGKYIEGSAMKFPEALRKGATSAYTENLFERSGTALLQGLGYPVKGLTSKITDSKFFQKYLIGEYARLKNLKPKTLGFKNNITKVLETAGFNGMVEEMLEEYGTNIANGILNGEDMGLDLHTFAVTLGTVAVWGGALGTVNKASYKLMGDNVRASYKDMTGTEQSIKIPRSTYTKLREFEGKKDPVSSKELETFLKEEKLNKEQTKFVLQWWNSDFGNKMVRDIKAKIDQEQKDSKKETKEEEKPKEEKKEKETTEQPEVDDAVDRNEFDDLDELNETLQDAELKQESDDKIKETKTKINETISTIKKKYHDDKALTDEMIDFDQMNTGVNVTVQRKVGKEKVNIPAEVLSIDNEKARIKYKNGTEDVIFKEDAGYSLFSNEKEETDTDIEGEFLSKENEDKKGYTPFQLKNGKNVYTKPVKINDVEGEYSIFRNEDGTWDIVDEEGEIQKFDKPTNANVQKNVVNAFKESFQVKDINELSGKTIKYKGRTGTLNVDEGGKITLETDNLIIEIPNEDQNLITEIISETNLKNKRKNKKNNIEFISENIINYDGKEYEIFNNKNGSIVSIVNNRGKIITDEDVLIDVEIERSKNDFNNISDEQVSDKNYEKEKLDNKILEVIEGIHAINYNDNIESAIGKLLQKDRKYDFVEDLTESEKRDLELWLYDTIERLDQAFERLGNEEILNAIDNLYILSDMLYDIKSNTKYYEKQKSKEVDTSKQKKKRKQEIKVKKESKLNKKKEIQKFDKPTNAKVQKNVVNDFKESKNKPVEAPKPTLQKRGQLIYSDPATGKTTIAKKNKDKLVDADILIAEEVKNAINDFVITDETKAKIKKLDPNNLDQNFPKLLYSLFREETEIGNIKPKNKTMESVYSKVKDRIDQSLESGKDVLTGSSRFLENADQIFTEDLKTIEERRTKQFGEKADLANALDVRQKRLEKSGKKATQLKGRSIADVLGLEEKTEKPKIEEKPKTEKKNPFEGLKLKNLEETIEKEIETQTNALKEDTGKLQIGIPFADRRTYIIFLKGIKELIKTVRSFNEFIGKLKKWMSDNGNFTQEELNNIYDEIDQMIISKDQNIEKIKDMFNSNVPFYEASKSIALSVEEKVNAHRKAFSSLFKNVSENIKYDKKVLEKKLHDIVMTGTFDGMKNEADYLKAIEKAKKENPEYEELFNELESAWDFNSAISLFNFYRSVRLVKQLGLIFTKNGVKIKTLNSQDTTNDLSKSFNNHINRISARTNDGTLIDNPNKAIKYYLNEYREKKNNINETSLAAEKNAEFDLQLELLEKLTGIDKGLWEGYFSPVTNETEVYLRKEDNNGNEKFEKVTFKDYRSLLNFDPNVLNKGTYEDAGIIDGVKLEGRYTDYEVYYEANPYKRKKAPAILNSLTAMLDNKPLSKLQEETNKFFTQGDEKANVYSNIKKLASTVQQTQDISIDGIDVEGNRFNSFQLMSHLFNSAENIHKSKLDNPLAKMYRDKNQPMEISIVNGISNSTSNTSSKGDKITESEYWLAQMIMFQNAQEGEYQGILGQFGDKKTMYVTNVKHYEKTNINELEKKFGDLKETRKFFNDVMLDGVTAGLFEGMPKTDRIAFIDKFIYNFSMNMQDVLEIFHGKLEANNYKNLTELVKRAGSTNSTGYRLDPYVEGGVGVKFNFVSAFDNINPDELGLSKEQFDGAAFYSGSYGEKLGVSMGSIYNKMDEYDGPVSSVKALFSTQKNQNRGLTKTNWYNIDVIAEAYKDYPDHYSHKLKKLIDQHGIDLLSFDSGTKKLEKKSHLVLFDKDGNIRDISNDEMNDHAFERNTSDIYIQQDLRHSMEPEKDKQSTQLMGNILSLQHAPEMVSETNQQVTVTIKKLAKKLSAIDNTQDKLDFLEAELENKDDDELLELIKGGASLFEPAYKNKIISIIASKFSKGALQKISNRVTTQELPADKSLKGYRKSEDGKYVLPAQIDVGIEGLRYEDKQFEGKQKDAEKHILSNKDNYQDLFDKDGNLKTWEIENGIIPGDYVLSTRVPADELRQHTLARARHKLIGNFTVLDKESQARSGSDYDGDQRFNQVLFRDKNGKIINNDIQANANNFLMNLALDYQNPENLDRILNPIETDYFDSVINLNKVQYDFSDPQGLNDARKNNVIGVVMKGVLSDLSMMSAIIANHDITPKTTLKITDKLFTNQFAKDKDGSLRNAIGILQNLAFDNAKDPKLEAMNINEVTAPMVALLMITDNRIDNDSDKKAFIIKKVKQISDYFNQPMLQEFIKMKREANGILNSKTDREIFDELNKKYGEYHAYREKTISKEVETLKSLYYSANDFQELKKYYGLTKSFPNNVSELLQALNTVDSFNQNSLNFFDVSKLNDSKIPTFKLVEESVRFAVNNLFNHTPELSVAGQMIFKDIVNNKKKSRGSKKSVLSGKEIEAVSRSLNQIIAIDAVNRQIDWKNAVLKRTDSKTGQRLDLFTDAEIKKWQGKPLSLSMLEKLLFERLPGYREKHINNKFLNAIQRSKIGKDIYSIKLADDYNFNQLTENELNEIRNDFEKLPEGLKNVFTLHAFQKYGLGQSTFKGNYFVLFSLPHRIKVSQLIDNEVRRWQDGFITQDKVNETTDWIISMNKSTLGEYKKVTSQKEAQKGIYDINTNPEYNIENETVRELLSIVSKTETTTSEQRQEMVQQILEREGISFEKFKKDLTFEKAKFGKDYNVAQYLTDMLQKKDSQINFEKPTDLYNLLQKYKPCKI